MKNQRLTWIAIGALLCAAGCTNSNVLSSGSATLRVNIVIENSPTRFDEAFFFLRQMTVLPTDPAMAAAFPEPLALFTSRDVLEINGNSEGIQFDVAVNLSTGPWRVDSILMNTFVYRDFDPPASTTTCEEYVADWSKNVDVNVLDFGGTGTFSIEPGEITEVNVVFDHAAFVSTYQDGFLFCFPEGVLGCAEAWCLYPFGDPQFSPAPLSLQATQYLSFE